MNGPCDFKWIAQTRLERRFPFEFLFVLGPVRDVRVDFCDPFFVCRRHLSRFSSTERGVTCKNRENGTG